MGNLIEETLKLERNILSELGYGLSEANADEKHPENYFKTYRDNIYEAMAHQHKEQYADGAGGEINACKGKPAKMASIRSSSAMTFNLLGNQEIEMKVDNAFGYSEGKYKITYEKKIETINDYKFEHRANLDALLALEDDSELIFCEMKMLEWFSKNTKKLKDAYKNPDNYELGDETIQFLKAIEVISQMSEIGLFKYYDVWQMFKHTVAIHNFMSKKGWENVKKVTLVNVVFEPAVTCFSESSRGKYEEQLFAEHEGFNAFVSALCIAGLIKDGKNFEVKYLSAKDFMDCFVIGEDKRNYLRRYTLED